MTRRQCCRENIRKIGPICGATEHEINYIERVANFCKEHVEISQLSTDAVKVLMDEPDKDIRDNAIRHIGNALNRKTPQGGTYTKKAPSAKEVNKSIRKAKREKHREEITKKSKENTELGSLIDLRVGDFREVLKNVPDNSLDFIITDPPYPKEFLDVFEPLAAFAGNKLKEGGLMLVMCGQSYFDKIIKLIKDENISYYWMMAYLTPGQTPKLWTKQVNTQWKPILIYSKGDYKGQTFNDVIMSEKNDKDHHEWGQSESGFDIIISRFCKEGDYICDPFLGGGTTALSAIKYNCKFVGSDLEVFNVRETELRLSKYQKDKEENDERKD